MCLHFDKQLLSHPLGVAVIVWKLPDYLGLVLDDFFMAHLKYFPVLLIPKVRRILYFLVDKPNSVAKSKTSRYLCKALEVLALLCQTHEL